MKTKVASLSDIVHQLRIMNELQVLDMCFKSGLISFNDYRRQMLKYSGFPLKDPSKDWDDMAIKNGTLDYGECEPTFEI